SRCANHDVRQVAEQNTTDAADRTVGRAQRRADVDRLAEQLLLVVLHRDQRSARSVNGVPNELVDGVAEQPAALLSRAIEAVHAEGDVVEVRQRELTGAAVA